MAALLNAGSKVLVFGGHAAVHAHSSNMPDGPLTAYFKFPAAFADPGVDIVLPGKGRVFDADCALGVVIGKPGGRMALTDTASFIAGFTLIVDVTDRAAFKIEASTHNGLLAKNLGGLSMIGPIIHPSPGNLPDPSITIEMTLNGEIVQSFSVGDLVVGFDQAMEAFSPMGYAAGDVIALGAMLADPSGDAAFQSPVTITPGDVIEVSADPIGKLTGAFTGRGR